MSDKRPNAEKVFTTIVPLPDFGDWIGNRHTAIAWVNRMDDASKRLVQRGYVLAGQNVVMHPLQGWVIISTWIDYANQTD